MEITSNNVITNLFWRFFERCGAQGVSFIVSLVLARLLEPEVYGIIAIVTVFTALLNVFVDSGFGVALIQKKDADETDFSTVFYFNIAFSLFLYLVIFLLAPLIAEFYAMPELCLIIRVLCITVLFSGIRNVQQAYLSRNMMFKKSFYVALISTIGSAIIGIGMAIAGFGVWALVGQQLSSAIITTFTLWFIIKWRPILAFSFSRLKSMFSFGWKLLASALIDTLYKDLRTLIIGKMYTTSDLAFYNKARTFPNFVISNINSSIDSVLLPALSAMQNDQQNVKAMTRRAIKLSTYIMMPLMIGLAVCSESVISLLLTDKWLPCVPYMRIFCITMAFYPIHTANLNAIKAMGRSDLFLKLEIMKKIVGLALLFSSMWFGVMAMAYTLLISSLMSQIINSWPNKKLLDYGYLEQLKDISENTILALVMGAGVYCVQFLNLNDISTLIVQVIVGSIIYIAGSIFFRLESYNYLLHTLKNLFNRRG